MLAYKSMLAELEASPKPGLVDRIDSGAHGDMDYGLFRRSADSIAPFFMRMEERARGNEASPELFAELREIGCRAEEAMFQVTGGVNTHKGQIFIFALLIAAAGGRVPEKPGQLAAAVRCMTAGMVRRELTEELKRREVRTHGERLYVQYGYSGIRGEAEAGFPTLFDTGLPAYSAALAEGQSPNDAAVDCLLHLMCACEDSTVLYRGGPFGLRCIREMSRRVLEAGGTGTPLGRAEIERMNRRCVKLNLSPGGSADLLAGTIFLFELLYG